MLKSIETFKYFIMFYNFRLNIGNETGEVRNEDK